MSEYGQIKMQKKNSLIIKVIFLPDFRYFLRYFSGIVPS